MKTKTILAFILGILAVYVTGCGGHEPNPVAAHQIGDDNRSCQSLRLEIAQNESLADKKTKKDDTKHKRGRGTKKTPVLAIVERNGKAISKPIDIVNAQNLRSAVNEVVSRQSTIMSDDLYSYRGIGQGFEGGHKSVNHSLGEYVNGDISTNTVESYFALLKRGVCGTFHHISKKHLTKYCDEFSFRWNFRKVSDGERAMQAIKGVEGKRLLLKP
jgi:transposase-like protein